MKGNGYTLEGMYRGVHIMSSLITQLTADGREDLIPKLAADTELAVLLLQQHGLLSEEEYDYLSEKADEDWERGRNTAGASKMPAIAEDPLEMERELRIKLLEVLSEECEDELYNEVAVGLDDELFQKLLKKYNIS